MLDFAALPPEINSGRIYAGPGAAPMLAAATAWDVLAAELFSTATGYGSVLSELSHGWRGPTSWSMATAAAPYVAWLHGTAVIAERTAAQAKAAAAAYELAFAMTVPPPVIAANRSLLLALIATNFLGQNAPAIAATEAHYAQMWIQDAVAMYGYSGSSAAASRLTPFTRPTTNAAAAQPGAVAHATTNAAQAAPAVQATTQSPTLVDYLEHVPNVVNTFMSNASAATSARGIAITNSRLAFQAAQDEELASGFGGRLVSTVPATFGGSTVSAAVGRATMVGSLSTPPGWAQAAPEIRTVALTLPSHGANAASATADLPLAPGSVFSQTLLGTLSRRGYDEPRHKSKPVIVRSPAAG